MVFYEQEIVQKVTLEFLHHPEHIRNDIRFLLCEGRTKVIGKITEVNK